MVSALTMFGFTQMIGRYATYPALADLIRARFTQPDATLQSDRPGAASDLEKGLNQHSIEFAMATFDPPFGCGGPSYHRAAPAAMAAAIEETLSITL